MAKRLEEISAEFDYERNVFGNSSEDERTIIGLCADGTIIKGRAREGSLETGLTYRFYGSWVEHPRYGRQFAFQSFTLAIPVGQRGTIAYLQRGPGIGKKRAIAIWEAFGPESLEALRNRPEEVAAKVNGLTVEKAREAATYFETLAGLEAVTIELTDLLNGRGFPRKLVEELIGEYGNTAPGVIRERPYVLMRYRGVGFSRADALYLELGKDAAAIERQSWCIWHALHKDSNGDTWFAISKAVEALKDNLSGADGNLQQAIDWAVQERMIVVRVVEGETYIAEWAKAKSEDRLASFVHKAELEADCELATH